ncbi:MAG: CBS domain-containing protein [Terriglobales bacterium]
MGLLHLCDEQPATVRPETSASAAIQLMLLHRVGAVTVVDDGAVVAGVFTERDVLRKLVLSGKDPANTPVAELMTTPVVLATPDTSPGEAFSIMMERHFRHLPIVDDRGRLVGMLSIRNLLQWRVDELTDRLDTMEQYMTNDAMGG